MDSTASDTQEVETRSTRKPREAEVSVANAVANFVREIVWKWSKLLYNRLLVSLNPIPARGSQPKFNLTRSGLFAQVDCNGGKRLMAFRTWAISWVIRSDSDSVSTAAHTQLISGSWLDWSRLW